MIQGSVKQQTNADSSTTTVPSIICRIKPLALACPEGAPFVVQALACRNVSAVWEERGQAKACTTNGGGQKFWRSEKTISSGLQALRKKGATAISPLRSGAPG